VEILFLFHGMEFGLLRFWEVMTQLVTWRSSWKCKQPCCDRSVWQ